MKEILSRCDKVMLISTAVLMLFGMVMIYSASTYYAANKFGDEFFFLKRHAVYMVAAVCLGALFMRMNPYKLKGLAVPLFAFCVVVLLLVPFIGTTISGARRWITVGGFTFQPSELAKLALVLVLARTAAGGRDMSSFKRGFLPFILIAAALVIPLMLQPDFGTAVFSMALALVILFVSGARLVHIAGLLAAAVPMAALMVKIAPYRTRRILAFLDPWADPRDAGFQIIQSFLAFARGGLAGVGLGDSAQKMAFLPEAHTDFIFSVIGEEIGFWGVALVIGLFCVLLVRGVRTALRQSDPFLSFTAFGLTTALCLQALVNMGVATGALPTKGLTLPFLSYGGTSLVVTVVMSAVLIRLSAQPRMPVRRGFR